MEGVKVAGVFLRRLALVCLHAGVAWGQVAVPSSVVFVCEHGSAKSLVAASHFNRLAEARGLSIRAVAKGLAPDAGPPEPVRQGLNLDGIPLGSFTPVPIRSEDFRPEVRVISLSCALEGVAPKGASFEAWMDLPAVSDGYAPAREAILERVRRLLLSLEPAR